MSSYANAFDDLFSGSAYGQAMGGQSNFGQGSFNPNQTGGLSQQQIANLYLGQQQGSSGQQTPMGGAFDFNSPQNPYANLLGGNPSTASQAPGASSLYGGVGRVEGPMGAYFETPGVSLSEQAVGAMFGDQAKADEFARMQQQGYMGALARQEQAATQGGQQILESGYQEAQALEDKTSAIGEGLRERASERTDRIESFYDEAIAKAEERKQELGGAQALGLQRQAANQSKLLDQPNPDGSMKTPAQREAMKSQIRYNMGQQVQSVVSQTQGSMNQQLNNMGMSKASGMQGAIMAEGQTDQYVASMNKASIDLAANMRTNAQANAARYAAEQNTQTAIMYQNAPMGFASMAETFVNAFGLMAAEDTNMYMRQGGVSQEFMQNAMGGRITYAT